MQRDTGLLRIVCPLALAGMLAAIWLLTVQAPAETMALSGRWATLLSELTGLAAPAASWVVRKVVHTVEYFPVGLLAMLALCAWNPQARARRAGLALAVAFCFACSLGDQVHKTFVPGREFDALDLCFDAAGYLLGIALGRFLWQRLGRARR